MKKLPKKYAGVLFSFYASTVMVLIVSAVLVALNTGIDAGYLQRLLKSYLITWPVAFASLLGVRPLVVKWVAASVSCMGCVSSDNQKPVGWPLAPLTALLVTT